MLLQHTATHARMPRRFRAEVRQKYPATRCNTLQDTAAAIHCNAGEDARRFRAEDKPKHAATHCNTLLLQRTATRCCCNALQQNARILRRFREEVTIRQKTTRCNTLQHAATRCNTLLLQHTATHARRSGFSLSPT